MKMFTTAKNTIKENRKHKGFRKGIILSTILYQMFYGNLNPSAESFIQGSEYEQALKSVIASEEKLMSVLDEDVKKEFRKFCDAHSKMDQANTADSFVSGFSIGMMIAIEVMEKRY